MPQSPLKKIILITGCSSGFGLLMAARFASQGHKVIATMRNLEKQGALLSEVNMRGGEIDLMRLDVTDKANVKDVMVSIAEKYDYLDVLINNAGYGIGGFFEDLSDEDIRAQLETNFFGVQNVTREAITLMRPRRSGKIINISSIAGFSASPCFGAYNASKWALEGFSESLRYELALFGIDVLLIQPGSYRTEIFEGNAKYAKGYTNSSSPYFKISMKLRDKVQDFVEKCTKDPEEVAILAEKLIRSKNPPFRSHPNWNTRSLFLLRKILPFRLYSWILKKALSKELSQ